MHCRLKLRVDDINKTVLDIFKCMMFQLHDEGELPNFKETW